jgi:hypothetical protein
MIDFRNFEEIMQSYEKYHKLQMTCQRYSHGNQQEKYNIAAKNRDDYDNNVYALAVFRAMSLLNPMMVEVRTGKRFTFLEIFGNDFDKLDGSKRRELTRLVEWGYSIWTMEECVTTVKGEILKTITMYDRKKQDGKSEVYEIQRLP